MDLPVTEVVVGVLLVGGVLGVLSFVVPLLSAAEPDAAQQRQWSELHESDHRPLPSMDSGSGMFADEHVRQSLMPSDLSGGTNPSD